jgi:hypothetical protein
LGFWLVRLGTLLSSAAWDDGVLAVGTRELSGHLGRLGVEFCHVKEWWKKRVMKFVSIG